MKSNEFAPFLHRKRGDQNRERSLNATVIYRITTLHPFPFKKKKKNVRIIIFTFYLFYHINYQIISKIYNTMLIVIYYENESSKTQI